MGYKQVQLECDSKALVQSISSDTPHQSHLLQAIWKILHLNWTVQISHAFGEETGVLIDW